MCICVLCAQCTRSFIISIVLISYLVNYYVFFFKFNIRNGTFKMQIYLNKKKKNQVKYYEHKYGFKRHKNKIILNINYN